MFQMTILHLNIVVFGLHVQCLAEWKILFSPVTHNIFLFSISLACNYMNWSTCQSYEFLKNVLSKKLFNQWNTSLDLGHVCHIIRKKI